MAADIANSYQKIEPYTRAKEYGIRSVSIAFSSEQQTVVASRIKASASAQNLVHGFLFSSARKHYQSCQPITGHLAEGSSHTEPASHARILDLLQDHRHAEILIVLKRNLDHLENVMWKEHI